MAVTIDGTNGITVDTIGTIYPLVRMTAQNSTSGTVIDFTGIPSWAKRITVMFIGVSTNGTSSLLIRLGSSAGILTTGYASTASATSGTGSVQNTSIVGFQMWLQTQDAATTFRNGMLTIVNIQGTDWVAQGGLYGAYINHTVGAVTLGQVLDRVRVTTVNGTDTFDAGVVNVIYEG